MNPDEPTATEDIYAAVAVATRPVETLKFICHRMKGAKEKNSAMMVANLLYAAHLGVESVVIATPPPFC